MGATETQVKTSSEENADAIKRLEMNLFSLLLDIRLRLYVQVGRVTLFVFDKHKMKFDLNHPVSESSAGWTSLIYQYEDRSFM